MKSIDLNLDAGENMEQLTNGAEAKLYDLVSSVNIACGGHAGDEHSMREAVRLAKARGLAIGAHPSYPDRSGFGRAKLNIEPEALTDALVEQIKVLRGIVASSGLELTHVKPHGMLYNVAADEESTAQALIAALHKVDARLPLVGLAGSRLAHWSQAAKIRFIGEGFVDRAYEADGSLRNRALPGALISSPDEAATQALDLVRQASAKAFSGERVAINAETLCIHGDTPNALRLAQVVRQALDYAGVRVQRLS